MVSQQTVDLEIAGSNLAGPINNWGSGVAVAKRAVASLVGVQFPRVPLIGKVI